MKFEQFVPSGEQKMQKTQEDAAKIEKISVDGANKKEEYETRKKEIEESYRVALGEFDGEDYRNHIPTKTETFILYNLERSTKLDEVGMLIEEIKSHARLVRDMYSRYHTTSHKDRSNVYNTEEMRTLDNRFWKSYKEIIGRADQK